MTTVKKDFTEGPLFFRIFLFAIPVMLTGLLQHLYNMADHFVVGRFSGDPFALAAVGSTGSLISLVINLALGLTAGVGVLVAQHYGARRDEDVSRVVHTGAMASLISGVAFGVLGIAISRPALLLMGTKPEILEAATLYMRIYLVGFPATMLFNCGAAALRAVGNSRVPLYILAASGVANVGMNVFFVAVCGMGVEGVALATAISQYISCVAVWVYLYRVDGSYRFRFRSLGIARRALVGILRIGIPSGVQGSLFAVSNVIIASAVNTFSTATVSGNTVASNIDALVYFGMTAYYQAALTVTGQNYGARKMKRVYRGLLYSLLQVTMVGVIIGAVCFPLMRQLSSLFVDTTLADASLVLDAAEMRLSLMLPFYFLCGIMETLTGYLRGIGFSVIPMLSSLFGACFFRVFWVTVLFPLPALHSLYGLFASFPFSWLLTTLLHFAVCLYAVHREKKCERAAQKQAVLQ